VAKGERCWLAIAKNQKDKTANAVFSVMGQRLCAAYGTALVRRANARRPIGAAVSALRVAERGKTRPPRRRRGVREGSRMSERRKGSTRRERNEHWKRLGGSR
jgi:hypothetical protein